MLKRAAVAFILITVAFVGFSWLYVTFFTSEDGAERRAKNVRDGSAQTKPWNGELIRVLDTSFVRQTGEIRLRAIRFRNLHTPATDVTARFDVATVTGTKPRWLTAKTFQMRSASQRIFRHTVKFQTMGNTIIATVNARNLPTAALENDCNAALGDRINLLVYPVDGLFGVCLNPQDPPAGHQFDEPRDIDPQCAPAAAGLRALAKQAADRRRKIARTKSKAAKRKLTKANRRASKRDSRERKAFQAIAKRPSCNPRKPTQGRKLTRAEQRRDERQRRLSADPDLAAFSVGGSTP